MKYILTLLTIILLISCKRTARDNEITKIELSRSGAWSDFGATTIIDSAFNYQYFDENKKQGYEGRINQEFWNTINKKFESIKFKTISSSANIGCEDCEIFELVIHWRNKKKRVLRVWNEPADSIVAVFKWIDTSYKTLNLHKVKRQFKFETSYPNYFSIKPNISRVKFPPPIPKHSRLGNNNY